MSSPEYVARNQCVPGTRRPWVLELGTTPVPLNVTVPAGAPVHGASALLKKVR